MRSEAGNGRPFAALTRLSRRVTGAPQHGCRARLNGLMSKALAVTLKLVDEKHAGSALTCGGVSADPSAKALVSEPFGQAV